MFNVGMASSSSASAIWSIISVVLAVVGGIVLYFTFLRKKNDGKFKGFLGWLYDFLTFKKMMIEEILRVCYLIMAIFITLASFKAGNFYVAADSANYTGTITITYAK